ncbi:MAG: hypothetical protein HY855_02775 [Burkholderiales bacterium]|nr:hypothetical protein [Burkholderiales bacterium]
MTTTTMTLQEFHDACKAQSVPTLHLAFKCPMCGTVQSAYDLIKAGAGHDFDAVEPYLAFSCVGRFTGAGSYKRGEKPGRGCNWTLGGLFQVHKFAVITPDGKTHPRFELATADEAKRHMEAATTVEAA